MLNLDERHDVEHRMHVKPSKFCRIYREVHLTGLITSTFNPALSVQVRPVASDHASSGDDFLKKSACEASHRAA